MVCSLQSPTKSSCLLAGGLLMFAIACGTEDSSRATAETIPTGPGSASPGCGSATPLQTDTVTIDIDGTARTYLLDVPPDYDPDTPYRLIFVWHPLGSSATAVANSEYSGLKALADGSAIFVAPEGLDGAYEVYSGHAWWNEGDGDMKFFTAMLEQFNANLCIDQERIFSTGFSFGGNMSYTLGFQFDAFRAIAPNSGRLGSIIPHEENNTEPLAIMALHGDSDTVIETSYGRDALGRYVDRNGCDAETESVEPFPCIEYQGCAAPAIWCEYPGAHTGWSEAPQAIWSFFSQF